MRGRRTKPAGSVPSAWALGAGPLGKWRVLWQLTKNLRARLGLAKHRPERVFTLKTRLGNLSFRDNGRDITGLAAAHGGAYRWRKLDGEGMIIDAGAGTGLAGVWFAHHNPDKPVWCIEPDPSAAALLRRNCWQARILAAALGETKNTVVRTLDECAAEYGWGEVALLRVGAGRMAPGILRGGRKLLARTARAAVETRSEEGHGEALAILRNAGFEIEVEFRDGESGTVFATRKPAAG